MTTHRRDLHVLVADEDMRQTLEGVLQRPESPNIRPIDYTIDRHVNRDPGCRTQAVSFLHPSIGTHEHALVIFDMEGSGADRFSREQIQADVEDHLRQDGWGERAKVVVIDPELEARVWSQSPHVAYVLGWGSYSDLRSWLENRELWRSSDAKPPDPKAAMKAALKEQRVRASAVLFRRLADAVSLRRCQCPAFGELRETLAHWFPVG